jgi:acyl-CoA synthetase (AMP-forming)/AMP-acid ligase II
MLHHDAADTADTSALEVCVSGGAAMPVEIMRSFEATFGCEILEGYGTLRDIPVGLVQPPGRRAQARVDRPPRRWCGDAARRRRRQPRVHAGSAPRLRQATRGGLQIPRRVWLVDELPEGPTGKIVKREIEPPA